MPLNSAILKRIINKTEDELEIRDFIVKLLEFESETRGWWKQEYYKILEQTYMEVEKSEDY